MHFTEEVYFCPQYEIGVSPDSSIQYYTTYNLSIIYSEYFFQNLMDRDGSVSTAKKHSTKMKRIITLEKMANIITMTIILVPNIPTSIQMMRKSSMWEMVGDE